MMLQKAPQWKVGYGQIALRRVGERSDADEDTEYSVSEKRSHCVSNHKTQTGKRKLIDHSKHRSACRD